jgi:PEP-CTERM motif
MRNLIFVLGIAIWLAPNTADADPLTIVASGTLDYACSTCVQDLFGFTAAAGDPFTVRITVGSASPDQLPGNPVSGSYSLSHGAVSVTVGSSTFNQPQPFHLRGGISNYGPSGPYDVLDIESRPTAPNFAGIFLQGWDLSAMALDSDAWPADPGLALQRMPHRYFALTSWIDPEEPGFSVALGTPTIITQGPAPVPEPTTLLLVGTGLIAAAGTRGRYRRRTR